jgi:hypothetical protein
MHLPSSLLSVHMSTRSNCHTLPSRYLLAPSSAEKWNITWGGQTFGGPFASDGRLQGQEFVYELACDTANNVCPVTVPAPGVALVFLSDQAKKESTPTASLTYSTSVLPTVGCLLSFLLPSSPLHY